MIVFRHADPRYPFFREDREQPAARWHGAGQGPVQYLSDTPDGAWAEFLRHEEIRDPEDLATLRRAIWAVEIGSPELAAVELSEATELGGPVSYPACQREAARLRKAGASGLSARSAALKPAGAGGLRTHRGGLQAAPSRTGRTIVLFGSRPDCTGWRAAHEGRPAPDLLPRVRHY